MKLGSEIQTVALYPLHGLVIEKIDSYIIQKSYKEIYYPVYDIVNRRISFFLK